MSLFIFRDRKITSWNIRFFFKVQFHEIYNNFFYLRIRKFHKFHSPKYKDFFYLAARKFHLMKHDKFFRGEIIFNLGSRSLNDTLLASFMSFSVKSPFVMNHFRGIFREFEKNCFQIGEALLWGCFWSLQVMHIRQLVGFHLSYDCIWGSASLKFPRGKFPVITLIKGRSQLVKSITLMAFWELVSWYMDIYWYIFTDWTNWTHSLHKLQFFCLDSTCNLQNSLQYYIMALTSDQTLQKTNHIWGDAIPFGIISA